MKQCIQIFPVLSGILWGSAGVFVRDFTALGMDSITVVNMRIIPAIILIIIGTAILDKNLLKIRLKDSWIFSGGGILGMLSLNLCYNEAINHLTLSLAAVLLSLAPVFVLILASIIFKEKLTLQKIICVILAIVGCVFSSGVFETVGGLKWSFYGILLGTCGAFFYGIYSIFSKLAMARKYHCFTITIYCLLFASIALSPFTNWHIIGEVLNTNPVDMGFFMIFHSIFVCVLPYTFFTIALNYVEAGKVAILASGEPVAAMIFGIFFFNEIPTYLSILGLILVLLALCLLSISAKKLSLQKNNLSKNE